MKLKLENAFKIAINPCMYPSATLNLNFKKYESFEISDRAKMQTFGIFAKDDEFFSYLDEFRRIYSINGVMNFTTITGEHRPSVDELLLGFQKAKVYKDNL